MNLKHNLNENGDVFTVKLEPGMILELERQEMLGPVNGVVFGQAVIREGQRFLDYPVSGYRSLEAVCREIMTKEKFLNIEKRLTEAGLAAEAAGIPQQLAAEPDMAFVSEGDARICYVPVQGFAGAGLRYLLLEVIYRSSFSGEEDCTYAQTVVNFLRNSKPFSLRSVHNLLTSLEAELPPSVQFSPSGTASEKGGTVLISEAVQLREQARVAEVEARREAEIKAAEEEARREAEIRAAEAEARREAEARAAEEEAHQEEKKTEITNLIHEKTDTRVPVIRPVLKIGKKAGLVDYCIEGNPSISRHHADIVSRDGECYLVDRGSLNKSYVNGRLAEPNQEIPLNPGDKISLADEIFTVE